MTVKLDARRLEAAATPALQALIDNQTCAGCSAAVWQGDELVYQRFFGQRDREADIAYDGDAIVRIYSMSKPITGALMAFLWDRGLWHIDDPVAHYIPEFAQARVYVSGGPDGYRTEPAKTTMTLRHLFTHTAGLSYGFAEDDPVDQIYRHGLLAAISRATITPICKSLWPCWHRCRCASIPAPATTTRSPSTCWGGWLRLLPTPPSATCCAPTCSSRWAWSTPISSSTTPGSRGLRPATATPTAAAWRAWRARAMRAIGPAIASGRAAAGSPRRCATMGAFYACCSTTASWMACACSAQRRCAT